MPSRHRKFLFSTIILTSSLFAQTIAPAPPKSSSTTRPAPALTDRTYERRLRFQITISPTAASAPVSGRLLVLMSGSAPSHEYLEPPYGQETESVWIAARDIPTTRPGGSIALDPDQVAFPTPFSKAPAGDYWIMAMIDHDNDAAYRFLTSGDLVMKPIKISALRPAIAGTVKLTINQRVPDKPAPEVPDGVDALDFVSPLLTAFWGRDIHLRGWIVLPPNYRKNNDHYPVVYWTHGFGARLDDLLHVADKIKGKTGDKKYPEMIWVVLDESFPSGTHEFADSVNNGPWGEALTEELIPFLESRYRMDGRASGRFLTGHSSGGWATMWLQVRYPTMFGGTWSTSPDPTDFHRFTGPDLVSCPLQNFYRDPSGHPWPLVRIDNENVETLEQYARQEAVVGPLGGQMASFEWVFSPRCPDGSPCELFDRVTGEVHPEVAKYWEEHYDIAHLVQTRWADIGPDLKGKIHLIVGTWDTFHLDEPARKLQAVLDALGADAHFTFIPGRDHFDLYEGGLDDQIAREMYEVARPGPQAGSERK